MNYAFYVSGNAGRLRKLIDCKSKVLNNTKLVISDSIKNLDLAKTLKSYGIDFQYFDYKNEKGINMKLSNFIFEGFNLYQIDYCFCFGDHILKGKLLDEYKNKIINFHPSILPMYPGRRAIDQALVDNSTILLGNTAHFIDNGIDTGPVILQSVVPKSYFIYKKYEGILDIQLQMLEKIYDLIEKKLIKVQNGKVAIQKEDLITDPVFYYST